MKIEYCGWAAIAAVVIAADVAADRSMSDAFHTASRHPVGGPIIIAAWIGLTAHLFGMIPPERDILHLALSMTRTRFRGKYALSNETPKNAG